MRFRKSQVEQAESTVKLKQNSERIQQNEIAVSEAESTT
jgi:hypothetical protein